MTCLTRSTASRPRQAEGNSLPAREDVLDAGIIVVTLADRKEYTAKSRDGFDLLYALLSMMRSYEESVMNGVRPPLARKVSRGGRPLAGGMPATR